MSPRHDLCRGAIRHLVVECGASAVMPAALRPQSGCHLAPALVAQIPFLAIILSRGHRLVVDLTLDILITSWGPPKHPLSQRDRDASPQTAHGAAPVTGASFFAYKYRLDLGDLKVIMAAV